MNNIPITSSVLRLWKGRLSQRYKPSTVHRYLMYLSAVLDFAVECDWLETNPMQRIRKPSPGRGRVRFLTEDECPRLLHACRENSKAFLYPMVMIALSTGGRKNEIRTLRWPAVDFAQGVVRFLKTKTHEPRSVPLVGEARSVLEELAQRRPPASAWVFPQANGREAVHIDYAWTVAMQRAGITNFRFHDLRHTFASYMCMSGATLLDVAAVLGHRKIQNTMQYSHLLHSHVSDTVATMAAAFLHTDHPYIGETHDHA